MGFGEGARFQSKYNCTGAFSFWGPVRRLLMLDIVGLGFAFTAGTVAAFNPCGAAMFPAYVGYQLGNTEGEHNPVVAALRGIMLGLSATAGFIVVFGVVGVILALGGRVVGDLIPFASLGVGVIITGVGLWLIVSRRKIGIMAASRVNLGGGKGLKQVFLFGIGYAIASLSCALVIFLSAVGVAVGASSAGNTLGIIINSLAYGLGMGVIMIAAAVAIVFFKGLVQSFIRKIFPLVEPIGNFAMVGAGSYLIYYWTVGDGRIVLDDRIAQYF
jgi:cytochrome c-type biogenesis protein